MTRLLAHAVVAVAFYVADQELDRLGLARAARLCGRLGDRVAARAGRRPWARET